MKHRRPVYEHDPNKPLAEDQYDGMEEMLGDDILPTDWDPETEDPPHEAWFTHVDSVEAKKKVT